MHLMMAGPGFRKERVQYINANHRDICKFDNPDDPNYITLKNAIASATEDILRGGKSPLNLLFNMILMVSVMTTKIKDSNDQMNILKTYLCISDSSDENYPRVEGSCQWIDDREDFQEWRDSAAAYLKDDAPTPAKNPSVLWVTANPGTGKTFLAAHVVEELTQFQLECASYYFHAGNKTAQTLGSFMRSIAYQMAASNSSVREKLLALYNEGSTFDKDDAGTIWTKLFKRGILQVRTSRFMGLSSAYRDDLRIKARIRTPQYWVIDAIDECSKYQELFTLIKGIQPSFPLQIFITSRKLSDMQHLIRSLEPSMLVNTIGIETEDSIGDIESYIQYRTRDRPISTIEGQEDLVDILLRRSNACFLWVRLVLDELEQVYSNESVLEVLHNIPEGMIPYYERTIGSMAEKKREKHIAKAVLLWVVASSRKLVISELSHALKLDINAVLPSARSAVEGLCGQLVSVDHSNGLVDLVHPTVREFLLSEAAAEFSLSRPRAHERIALTCLQLLCSPELQPPRSQRQLSSQSVRKKESSPLLDYAITQFSEHVCMASSETDELLLSLDRFFRTTVLSWIEKIARKGDLHPLIRVSRNLKSYLNRRAKYRSPLNIQVQNLESWSTDLSRITTKFGTALLENPGSIYFLIPPLCPSTSAIYQRFAKRPDGLMVVGDIENAWDDCVASITFSKDTIAAAVSCGERTIAVGMESGEIELYDQRSYQKVGLIQGKHPVDLVHLTDNCIVACTTKAIILMDRSGNIAWQTRLRFRCILLTSTPEAIIAVSQHGHVLKWDISTGSLLEDQVFTYRSPDDETEVITQIKAPHVATLSPDVELLALGYRWGTVCMWEVSSGALICWARDDENRLVSVLMFNPNPSINLLLVIFRDHELALYDTWSGGLVTSQASPSCVGVLSATCSLDGRTLATMDPQGILQIWDFESLNLLYHVSTPSTSFRILNFTSDGTGVVDIIDSGMSVWSPAALVRKTNEEDQSVSEDAINLPPIEGEYEMQRTSRISALCAHPLLPLVFAGKQDGQVSVFSTRTGEQMAGLYVHDHSASIMEISVSKSNILASRDIDGVVQVWHLGSGQLSTLDFRSMIFQVKLSAQVIQICFTGLEDHLLISAETVDKLFHIRDGQCVGSLHFAPGERRIWRWFPATTSGQKDELFLLRDKILLKYDVPNFSSEVGRSKVQLCFNVEDGTELTAIAGAAIIPNTQTLAVDVRHSSGFISSSTMFLFEIKDTDILKPSENQLQISSTSLELSKICKYLIGINERAQTVTFLHQNSWICSIEAGNLSKGRFSQHFFVPTEYISARNQVLPVRTVENGIVFCLNGGLAIVKNGFNFRDIREVGN